MSTATKPRKTAAPQYQNLAEVLEAVGNIPPHRIRMTPAPGEATEEDLLRIVDRKEAICELVAGILVEKDMASFESNLASILIIALGLFQKQTNQKLGAILGEAGLLRLFPGRVRAPDVSFIPWKSMPNRKFPKDPIASLTPDLAVEILSQNNTEAEMKLKLREYFQAGSRLVWLVDPKTRTVRVHTSPRKSVLLTEDQSVDGGKVLPGFSLSIRTWFAEAEGEG